MKINTFPVNRFSVALLAASLIGLPFTSQARPDPESRRERPPGSSGRPSQAQPRSPTPSARPSVPQRPVPSARPSTPQRPPTVSRPSIPQQRPTPSVRPGASQQRPSVVSRPDFPQRPSVTRPSTPQRPPSVGRPNPERPGTITRPSLPSRPSSPNGIVQRPGRDSDRNEIRRPDGRRPDFRPTAPSRRPGINTASSSRHRHFHDSSRFAHIDRSSIYRSYPRHHYRLCHGNGYRGLGWYFGPPNVSYYYETPGVYYYSAREYAPSTYINLSYSPANSLDYAVQEALADLGYYDGPLDGDIGPMSRLSIANFQADNGLEPTGIIDETLVNYLGIE